MRPKEFTTALRGILLGVATMLISLLIGAILTQFLSFLMHIPLEPMAKIYVTIGLTLAAVPFLVYLFSSGR